MFQETQAFRKKIISLNTTALAKSKFDHGILLWHFWLSHWLTCPFKETDSVPMNRADDWHSPLQVEYLSRKAAKEDSETRNCFSSSSLYLSLHFLSVVLLNFDKEVEISASVHPGKVLLLWRSLWSWGSGVIIINIGPCRMCFLL